LDYNIHVCSSVFIFYINPSQLSIKVLICVSSQGGLKDSVFPKQYSNKMVDYNEGINNRHQRCLIIQQ